MQMRYFCNKENISL